jgi:dipeptidyl aminopeptidase/acylaminoacyl peptidase
MRLTDGDAESSPVVSPDGTRMVFLRADREGKPQLHWLSVESGEIGRLSTHRWGVDCPVWSPDSRFIAYTAYHVVDSVLAQRATVRVTDLLFYSSAVGYTAGLARCVFVVEVDSGRVRQLTFDDADDSDLDWSPDGSRICFLSAKHGDRRNRPREDVWSVSVREGKVECHTSGGMTPFRPRFSPDGERIFFSGAELTEQGFSDGYASFGIWVVDVSGEPKPERVSSEWYNLSYVCQTIVPWGEKVYLGADVRGRVPLLAFKGSDLAGEGEVIIDGEFQVNGFDVAGEDDRHVVACVVASPGSAGDLYFYERGRLNALTTFGEQLRRRAVLREPTRIEAFADDGHPTEGWVLLPDGEGPHPVVLIVKGGPYTQFGYTMSGPGSFEDAQVLCEAGYLVVLGNPRGSAGYGQQHVTDVMDSLPTVTSTDLLALLRYALDQFPGRPDRVGVMGGSFGGYMAVWLAAATKDVFVGAIGERGCYTLDSYLATSDDGVNIVHALWGDDPTKWKRHSPLTLVDDIDIPVLLLHSDQDRHAPIEQARRLFTELKVRGKRAELLVFPGGNHELSRSGPISQRLARYGAILDWWRELLQD